MVFCLPQSEDEQSTNDTRLMYKEYGQIICDMTTFDLRKDFGLAEEIVSLPLPYHQSRGGCLVIAYLIVPRNSKKSTFKVNEINNVKWYKIKNPKRNTDVNSKEDDQENLLLPVMKYSHLLQHLKSLQNKTKIDYSLDAVGTIALKKYSQNYCELKRLYVRNKARHVFI